MIPHVRNESRAFLGPGAGVSGPGVSYANGHRNGMGVTEMSATIEIEDDRNFLSTPINEETAAQGENIPMSEFQNATIK